MSPTEDELRRSLSDGAGDVPDVDHIVSAAKEQRAQRTKRLLSAAAAVVVVGGVATGGTLLARSGDNGTTGKTSTHAQGTVAGGTVAGADAASAPSGGAEQAIACPAQVPNALLPGGGGTTQFGSTGMLFAQPVRTVTVCGYSSTVSSSAPTRVELTGSDATTFADSLDNAAKNRPTTACPDYRIGDQKSLAIIATTASGKQLPTVATALGEPACAVQITNGTAVRYGWSWPSSLRSELATVNGVDVASGSSGGPSTSVPVTTPGHIDGSPVH